MKKIFLILLVSIFSSSVFGQSAKIEFKDADNTIDYGCTVPSYPKEPIMPGKSGKIEVKYNMGVGPIRKTITIESNASNYEGGRIPLKIKGEVYVKEAVNVLEKKKSLISIEN